MTVILGLLFLFLMSWWVISIVNSQKPRKNETFIGYIQRYDIDGNGCQSELWEVTEEEDKMFCKISLTIIAF
ncbi:MULTISPECIES: hypothetical protein [unclassified Streptococcus]|uniref:hypothetical protein n=1 Tax=unclassified Streptococcus TaxID=2608887 RepID=UPI001563B7A7|nr:MULTISPECIES: hypothetical protein [unclassified Streptococcus]